MRRCSPDLLRTERKILCQTCASILRATYHYWKAIHPEIPFWSLIKAVRLAKQVQVVTSKPHVGAVIVGRDGGKIATGFKNEDGDDGHAEAIAIGKCKSRREELVDAILVTTHEPCTGWSRSPDKPPCSELIISAGIGTVVYAILDPSEKVMGYGVELLKANLGDRNVIQFPEPLSREMEVFDHEFRQNRLRDYLIPARRLKP